MIWVCSRRPRAHRSFALQNFFGPAYVLTTSSRTACLNMSHVAMRAIAD